LIPTPPIPVTAILVTAIALAASLFKFCAILCLPVNSKALAAQIEPHSPVHPLGESLMSFQRRLTKSRQLNGTSLVVESLGVADAIAKRRLMMANFILK
jgi:hypothetical protein